MLCKGPSYRQVPNSYHFFLSTGKKKSFSFTFQAPALCWVSLLKISWKTVWPLMFKNFSLQAWLPKVLLASGFRPPAEFQLHLSHIQYSGSSPSPELASAPRRNSCISPCTFYDPLLSWILPLVLFASAVIGCTQIDAFCDIFLVVLS